MAITKTINGGKGILRVSTCILLIKMNNFADIMKNSMEMPPIIKNRITIKAIDPTCGHMSERNENSVLLYAFRCSLKYYSQYPDYEINLTVY